MQRVEATRTGEIWCVLLQEGERKWVIDRDTTRRSDVQIWATQGLCQDLADISRSMIVQRRHQLARTLFRQKRHWTCWHNASGRHISKWSLFLPEFGQLVFSKGGPRNVSFLVNPQSEIRRQKLRGCAFLSKSNRRSSRTHAVLCTQMNGQPRCQNECQIGPQTTFTKPTF